MANRICDDLVENVILFGLGYMNKEKIEKILNEKITEWSELGSGMCNTVYKATTEKDSYSIKVVKSNTDVQETNTLLVEARITEALNQKNSLLPIPKIRHIDPYGEFYIYNFVDSVSLGEGDNGKYVNTLLSAMGEFHSNIDCIDKDTACGVIGIKEYSANDFMTKYGSGFEKYIHNEKLPDDYRYVLDIAFSVIEKTKNDNIHEQLLHNDIHGENIFLNSNGELDCVIDFGDAVLGDVHLDMMWYVHGYPNDWEKVVDSYEKRSGYIINKQKLIALACLRFTRGLCEWYLEDKELEHCNEKFRDYKIIMEKYITK